MVLEYGKYHILVPIMPFCGISRDTRLHCQMYSDQTYYSPCWYCLSVHAGTAFTSPVDRHGWEGKQVGSATALDTGRSYVSLAFCQYCISPALWGTAFHPAGWGKKKAAKSQLQTHSRKIKARVSSPVGASELWHSSPSTWSQTFLQNMHFGRQVRSDGHRMTSHGQ